MTASVGTTVVYITHRDEELAPFDEVAVVDAGRVVATYRRGDPADGPVADGPAEPGGAERSSRARA